MRAPTPAQTQAEWARLLLASLADAGVADVVVSPGSRSTPFVLAATREPRLRLWDVIDERAAAFFALGQARVTGRPSLLLCTSGTAGANYLPAVIEAGMSHTPLLVLTADRPVELAHCGANQTVDQIKLFGDHARRFFDLGLADDDPAALWALRRTAAQAVFATRWPEPGAVHLNARARKPLEPPADPTDDDRALAKRVDEVLGRPIVAPTPPRLEPDEDSLARLAEACASARRGLLVAGPAPIRDAGLRSLVGRLAARTGFAVFAETASQLRRGREDDGAVFVDAFDALLHSAEFRRRSVPDLIVQIGRSPTSGVWETYRREHADCPHWVIAREGWHDPTSLATDLLFAEPETVLRALLDRVGPKPASPWIEDLRRADELAWRVADEALRDDEPLSEGSAVREIAAALTDEALLVLGNSLPIRQFDTWVPGRSSAFRTVSQRGTSGIDGLVSGAAGAASIAGGPVVALVGDVSFLHDLSGLATLRLPKVPLVIVVMQNRGGRIFEQLPLASHPDVPAESLRHWLTPHEADLEAAAAVHGLPFSRAETRTGLREALAQAFEHPGGTVIEAVMPPHGAAEQNRRLWSRLDELLTRQ